VVLGGLRFTSPNHSRRHQKLTSPASFALKSDFQGSAARIMYPSCENDAAFLPAAASRLVVLLSLPALAYRLGNILNLRRIMEAR